MVYTNLEKMERKENFMKKFLIWFIILLLMIGIVFASLLFYANASHKGQSSADLKIKVSEEVRYIDSNLVLLLNSLNNISYENYQVQTQEIEPSKERFTEKVAMVKEVEIAKDNPVEKRMEVDKIIKEMIAHKSKARW